MRRRSQGAFTTALLSAWVAVSPAAADAGSGDAEAGRNAFRACAACHTVDPGGPSTVGPNLFGVVGREVASVVGFAYSDAFRALGGTWTAERLDRLVADPAAFAPGTRMVMKVPDPRRRSDLVAYLETLRPGATGPAPPAAADFGAGWPPGPGQVEAGRLCSACHSLAIVKQQRLSRATWDELLDWMVDEQGMAAQPPETRALILDYLVEHFGPPR